MRSRQLRIQLLQHILDIVQRLNLMLKQIDLFDRMLCRIQRAQTDPQMADFPAVVVTVKQEQRMLQQHICIIGIGMNVGGTNGIGEVKIADTDGY